MTVQDAALMVTSEMSVRLLPSTVPSVEIHTRTYEVDDALFTEMVLEPGFSGVAGVSSVVSDSDDGVADWAERICTEVPVLVTLRVTEPTTVGCGNCSIRPTP